MPSINRNIASSTKVSRDERILTIAMYRDRYPTASIRRGQMALTPSANSRVDLQVANRRSS